MARHAGVDPALLRVGADAGNLTITVTDQGAGFRPGTRAGFSLRSSVRGRLAEVGGRAVVESTPGTGTRVELLARPGGR